MRKRYIVSAIGAIAVTALVAMAGEPSMVPLVVSDVPTNATGLSATTVKPLYGWVHSVELDNLTAGETCTVSLVTVTQTVGDVETTILSVSGFTSSALYRPRFPVHLPATGGVIGTNDQEKLILVGQNVKLVASLKTSTNTMNIRCKIKLVD